MSQHSFTTMAVRSDGTKCRAHVVMGWDRPLQHHFLLIRDLDADDEDDDGQQAVLYSSLYELEPEHREPQSLDHFLEVVQELRIALPPSMIEAVIQDRIHNAGNRLVDYN